MTDEPISVYADTCSLQALCIPELCALITANKNGKLKLIVCDAVIWERSKHYYHDQADRLIPLGHPLTYINAWFQRWFLDHGVEILRTTPACVERMEEVLEEDEYYFQSTTNNDIRDALIYSIGEKNCDPKTVHVLSHDKRLAATFHNNGYTIIPDAKKFIKEKVGQVSKVSIPTPLGSDLTLGERRRAINDHLKEVLERSDPSNYAQLNTELIALPQDCRELLQKIEQMHDTDVDIKIKILGYIEWFSPISKEDLLEKLSSPQLREEVITANCARLSAEGIIIDTGSIYLPNVSNRETKLICEQAMNQIMDEIIGQL